MNALLAQANSTLRNPEPSFPLAPIKSLVEKQEVDAASAECVVASSAQFTEKEPLTVQGNSSGRRGPAELPDVPGGQSASWTAAGETWLISVFLRQVCAVRGPPPAEE